MRLVIGFDGTSNHDRESDKWTNVKRFLECVDDDPRFQRKHYIAGVGISGNIADKTIAQAMGIGKDRPPVLFLPTS